MKIQVATNEAIVELISEVKMALSERIENHNRIHELLEQLKNLIALNGPTNHHMRAA